MKQSVLITGGAGFIGMHLIPLLKAYEVYIVDALLPQVHGAAANFESFKAYPFVKECIHANINDVAAYQHLLSEVDHIIHLAAYTGTGQSMYQLDEYHFNNVIGTEKLIQGIEQHGHQVKKIILSSSRAVYGEGAYISKKYGRVNPPSRKKEDLSKGKFNPIYLEDDQLSIVATKETDLLEPISVYGKNKLQQEQIIGRYSSSHPATKAIIFRFQNVYGPGQSLQNPYTGVLGVFSNLMRSDLPIDIYEEGNLSRDFVFVEDVVKVIAESIQNNAFDGHIFNLGSGELSKLTEVATRLKTYLGSNSTIQVTPQFRLGDIAGNYADNSRLNLIYPNQPTTLVAGLKKYADWALEQPLTPTTLQLIQHSFSELKESGVLGAAFINH